MADRHPETRLERRIRRRPGPRRPRRRSTRAAVPASGAAPDQGVAARAREAEKRELDRVVFFSDAVFAIAITLLVLRIELPEDWAEDGQSLGAAIGDLFGNIVVFLWSFLIVGLFWIRHRQVFRTVVHLSERLVVLNILFLALIALLPFPADVLGRTGVSRASISLFAGTMAAAGLVLTAIWVLANRDRRLVEDDRSDIGLVREGLEIASLPVVFLIALAVAQVHPTLGSCCWLLLAIDRPQRRLAGWLTPRLIRHPAAPTAPAPAPEQVTPSGR